MKLGAPRAFDSQGPTARAGWRKGLSWRPIQPRASQDPASPPQPRATLPGAAEAARPRSLASEEQRGHWVSRLNSSGGRGQVSPFLHGWQENRASPECGDRVPRLARAGRPFLPTESRGPGVRVASGAPSRRPPHCAKLCAKLHSSPTRTHLPRCRDKNVGPPGLRDSKLISELL